MKRSKSSSTARPEKIIERKKVKKKAKAKAKQKRFTPSPASSYE